MKNRAAKFNSGNCCGTKRCNFKNKINFFVSSSSRVLILLLLRLINLSSLHTFSTELLPPLEELRGSHEIHFNTYWEILPHNLEIPWRVACKTYGKVAKRDQGGKWILLCLPHRDSRQGKQPTSKKIYVLQRSEIINFSFNYFFIIPVIHIWKASYHIAGTRDALGN